MEHYQIQDVESVTAQVQVRESDHYHYPNYTPVETIRMSQLIQDSQRVRWQVKGIQTEPQTDRLHSIQMSIKRQFQIIVVLFLTWMT